MPTLNHYRKQAGYPTIKAFAIAANLTPSIASQWLNGMRSEINPMPLLALLHLTSEQYYDAYEESRKEAQAKWREKHPVTQEMLDAHEASIKKYADEAYAKMSPEARSRIHGHAVRLGVASPERRSPLDILIDRACGLE